MTSLCLGAQMGLPSLHLHMPAHVRACLCMSALKAFRCPYCVECTQSRSPARCLKVSFQGQLLCYKVHSGPEEGQVHLRPRLPPALHQPVAWALRVLPFGDGMIEEWPPSKSQFANISRTNNFITCQSFCQSAGTKVPGPPELCWLMPGL